MANFEKIAEIREYLYALSQNPKPEVGFGMQEWVFKNGSVCKLHEGFCGSSACIAGHILIREKSLDFAWGLFMDYDGYRGTEVVFVDEFAADFLGLSEDEADWLFMGRWTEKELEAITLEETIDFLDMVLEAKEVAGICLGCFMNTPFQTPPMERE